MLKMLGRVAMGAVLVLGAAAGAGPAVLTGTAAYGAALEESFSDDPFVDHGDGTPLFERRGRTEAFVYEAGSPVLFEGDAAGSLKVIYDTPEPTAQAFAPLGALLRPPLRPDEDFTVSAVFVIRSSGFHADPDGFAQISFGLMNRSTTGDDRTGDPDDFRADTFDSLKFDYFPNVSPFFGGPFAGGAVFGGAAGDDAFANFAFATVPLALLLDVPLEAVLEHRAAGGAVSVRVYRILADGSRVPLHETPAVVRTDGLAPGFTLDAVGVFAYHDGFSIFSGSGRSLYAEVDYHRLAVEFEAPIPVEAHLLPDPLFVSTRSRFVRARLAPVDPADAAALAALAGEAPEIALWMGTRLLAPALRAEYDEESGELNVLFDAVSVLTGVGSLRGEVELQVRGAVEGTDRIFILGTASGGSGNPGRRRRDR